MRIPVGVAGPLTLDGTLFFVPMATTEGCLVASTNMGCRAVSGLGGVRSYIINDGMTLWGLKQLQKPAKCELKLWLDIPKHFRSIKEAFNSISNYARLKSVHTTVSGKLVYIHFKATTRDAMGMNMVSKASPSSLSLPTVFTQLGGQYCVLCLKSL